jgi:hypothetical protein
VAIGFYSASLGVSAASLVVNTASLATLIAGTVQAGQVAGRMGGDESLVEDFCESTEMDLNLAAEFEAQKAKLWQAREAARIAMEEAGAQLDEDKAVIEACRAGLGTALSESSVNLVGGGTCSLPGTYGSFCPALVTYLNQYTEFQADMSSLYPTLYAAEWALAETEEGIAEMEAKMAATNRNLADVQAEINAAVASYQEALEKAGLSGAALANAVAQKRADLETSYDEDYQNAVSELQALQTLKTTQQTAVSNAKAELETAIAGLTDPASVSNETRCGEQEPDEPPPPLVACAEKYYELCGEAYQLIAKPVTTTETVTINTADGGSYTMNYTKEYTGQFHAHWTDYESKKTLFETADEIHGEFAATPPPAAPECSPAGNDGTVKVWSVTDAVEVLRRVDKRSVLQ